MTGHDQISEISEIREKNIHFSLKASNLQIVIIINAHIKQDSNSFFF